MTHFACVPTSRVVRAPRPVAVAFALLALAGCDVDARIAVADGGPGAGCTGSLEQLQRRPTSPFPPCATTYDGALAQAACHFNFGTLSAGPCGGYLVFVDSVSTHSQACVYDATTRALVGARFSDDIPTYCNLTSSEISAGSVPACADSVDPVDLHRDCQADAATTDAAAPTACGTTPPFECDHATDGVCGDSSTWPTCTGGVWSCPAGSIRPSACRCTFTQGCACGTSPCADAGVDAGRSFPCGELRCDPGTQFCRGVSAGAATRRITYSCEALPTACGGAANCACVVPRETAGAACQEYSDGAIHVSLYTP